MSDQINQAGAFNFVFIPNDHDQVDAGTINVQQNDTSNSTESVSVSVSGGTDEFFVDDDQSNRGDYHVRIGESNVDDIANGIVITSIAQNGVDHDDGAGVQYGSAAIAKSSNGDYFISLADAPSGDEYNANVAAGYFTYDQFTAGWAENSSNGGEITNLTSSDDIVLGENFQQLGGGIFQLTLDGMDARTDGILLAIGGKNEDNYALSRPLDDGSGYLIGVRDNGRDGGVYEQDPVAFVYLEEGKTDLTFGRVLSDGSSSAGQGPYSIEHIGAGQYRLTIDGYDPSQGTLLVTAEGFDLLNQDNIVSFEPDGDGWIIQTRDSNTHLLQDAGEQVYGTALPDIELPEIDAAFLPTIEDSLAIWKNAEIDYGFVVGHRGGIHQGGEITHIENSLEMIDYAVSVGTNMIELDVQKTADGEFIVMHDSTVDRTTNGTGRVDSMTLEEIKSLNLVNEGTGEVTDFVVPTLEEALLAAKDKIMVNLDVKFGSSDFVEIMTIAHDLGALNQVVLKASINTQEDLTYVKETLASLPFDVDFMPIIDDAKVNDAAFVREVFETFGPEAVEVLVRPKEDDIVEDGGFLFSDEIQSLAEEYDVRLWINTLFGGLSHGGDLNGLRDDFLALQDPDGVYGFWREEGASVYQTDETLLAIDYLNSTGARFALDYENTYASKGNDIIQGSGSADQIFGLQGNDKLNALNGHDIVYAGSGHDKVNGGNGNDILRGEDGNDRLTGENGADLLQGGAGNDRLNGGNSADMLDGGAGSDVLRGGNGSDRLDGGDGADRLKGDRGADTLLGGTGDDVLVGGDSADSLDGGDGADRLRGGNGNDVLIGGDGKDRLRGDNGADTLEGNDGNDVLLGGNSADLLHGGAGSDILKGGNGNDILSGDGGNDRLFGEAGSDTFVFSNTLSDGVRDKAHIMDYGRGCDIVDIGREDINRIVEKGGDVHLWVGDDQDHLIFHNAQDYNDLVFA